ncbi:hypothetical protein GCM10011425_29220 [Mucilaginibacter galii]|uniref:Uncharacterized protein n=1 Tax=Mucilaginibacter galii TaxID=2005073 RepID=A0A917N284_9SPHI|nr:hypothetical protein GCM10011425_29220 [Mucilaginibacter galii]
MTNAINAATSTNDTKLNVLNSGRTLFKTSSFNVTTAGKNVYTYYLTDLNRTANAADIFKNGKYYSISINPLFL